MSKFLVILANGFRFLLYNEVSFLLPWWSAHQSSKWQICDETLLLWIATHHLETWGCNIIKEEICVNIYNYLLFLSRSKQHWWWYPHREENKFEDNKGGDF